MRVRAAIMVCAREMWTRAVGWTKWSDEEKGNTTQHPTWFGWHLLGRGFGFMEGQAYTRRFDFLGYIWSWITSYDMDSGRWLDGGRTYTNWHMLGKEKIYEKYIVILTNPSLPWQWHGKFFPQHRSFTPPRTRITSPPSKTWLRSNYSYADKIALV